MTTGQTLEGQAIYKYVSTLIWLSKRRCLTVVGSNPGMEESPSLTDLKILFP
jgi:hypothetical protein